MVRTLRFHCRGGGFNPWLGKLRPCMLCDVAKKVKKRKKGKKKMSQMIDHRMRFLPSKGSKARQRKTQKMGVSAWERVLRVPRVMVRADPGSCAQT